jgi:DNA-binding beta-propeller fold protein YncE
MNRIVIRSLTLLTANVALFSSALMAQQISLVRVQRLNPAAIKARPTGVGLTAVEGTKATQQSYPVAVAVVGRSAFVSDSASNSILVYASEATATAALAPRSFGTTGSAAGQFKDPRGIAGDAKGNLYVADSGNNRIQKLSAAGKYISQIGTAGSGKGQLKSPYSVAVDQAGNIFVADTGNHRIQKFSAAGAPLAAWGSQGQKEGQFFYPQGITLDQKGNVYVADFANHRIQKFDGSGKFLAAWGQFGSKPGEFNYPSSLTIDSQERLWVTDLLNHRLETFSLDGKLLGTVGSFSPNAASNTEFNFPRGVAVSAAGDLWIAHPGVHSVDHYKVEK